MKPRVVVAVTARSALDVVVGHIDHLHACGWEVHVVVGEETPEVLFPKARLHFLPMNRGISRAADLIALRRWWSLLRELRPDVVVAATPKASFLGLSAARAVDIPQRVWWAWGLRSEAQAQGSVRRAERITAAAATSVIAASPSLASSVATATGATPTVLGQGAVAGVDLDIFSPPSRPATQPVAVYIGRLAQDKGLCDLADVWDVVAARVPRARLLIAGRPDPLDPPSANWKAFTARREVTVLGWVDDVPGLLRHGRVLLLPSAREGMPAVVLEAGACAVPTIAWDVTGSRDAVAHGVTGYLCSHGHREEFAARTIELLGNPASARQLGDAARAHVAAHYNRRDVEEQFETYLRSLLASGSRRGPVDDLPEASPAVRADLGTVDLTAKTGAEVHSPTATARK